MRVPTDGPPVMSILTQPQLDWIERRSASAFGLAGLLILASLVVPIGLEAVTDSSWAVGLVLVGIAVVAVSIGLVGLSPRIPDSGRHLAIVGIAGATTAGVAALGVIGLAGIALVDEPAFGRSIAEPMRLFAGLALSMAGGFAIGLLAFGAAFRRTRVASRTVGGLLTVGGVALLLPVTIELVGAVVGLGTPPWLLFPVIAVVALDVLAIGHRLRSQPTPAADR